MIRIPGDHVPNIKNRSSKHLIPLTKIRPAIKSMSNAALEAMGNGEARKELKRRQDKRAKKNV